jgi:hypothetical protein
VGLVRERLNRSIGVGFVSWSDGCGPGGRLSVTYLRYGATNLMMYCMLYGFSQWLQTGPGFSSTKAGLITLPMSALAALSALAGGRMKSIRNPLILGTLGLFFAAGCIALITNDTAASLLVPLVLPFGLPQGICSNANQAAVYVQAPRGGRNRWTAAHFPVRWRHCRFEFVGPAVWETPDRSRDTHAGLGHGRPECRSRHCDRRRSYAAPRAASERSAAT